MRLGRKEHTAARVYLANQRLPQHTAVAPPEPDFLRAKARIFYTSMILLGRGFSSHIFTSCTTLNMLLLSIFSEIFPNFF